MEKKIIELNGCEREMVIVVEKSEIQSYFDKAYLEIQPDVELKGFRKGKVPVSVIKQQFGKRIEMDVMQDVSTELFNKAIAEDKLSYIGSPHLHDVRSDDTHYTITIHFEILPLFELKEYKGLQVNEPFHKVTDEEIGHNIHHLMINSGTIKDAETVLSDLFIVGVKLRKLDPALGLPLLGEKTDEFDVFLHDHSVMPDFRELFMNKVVGDTFRYNPSQTDHTAPDNMFSVEIRTIQEVVPGILNDEFVASYTKNKFDNVEDFKADIGFALQEDWNAKSREAMEKQIVDMLVDMHEFELPHSVVHSVMHSMAEDIKKQYKNSPEVQNLRLEDLEQDLRPMAERRVKWEIIKSRIIEKENLFLEEHDVQEIIEMEMGRMKLSYEEAKEKIMSNTNVVNGLEYRKLMDLLFDFAITTEVDFEGNEVLDDDDDFYDIDDEDDDDDDFYDDDEDSDTDDIDDDEDSDTDDIDDDEDDEDADDTDDDEDDSDEGRDSDEDKKSTDS